MYDADDPESLVDEFLVSLFVPGILVFVGLWAAFRLFFDAALRSYGLPPIVPAPGGGAIASDYGRLLLVLLATVVLIAYLACYVRFFRAPLRDRGIV